MSGGYTGGYNNQSNMGGYNDYSAFSHVLCVHAYLKTVSIL